MTRVAVLVNAVVAILLLSASHTHAIANHRNVSVAESSCNQVECLRCDLALSLCAKCRYVILEESRECLRQCPQGLDPAWSTAHNIFGKTCAERSVMYLVSQTQVGIIAGASVLGAIGIGTFVGVLLLRKKGLKMPPPDSPTRGLPKSLQDKRPKTAEVTVRGKERAEFQSRLKLLRNDAPYILCMMAATRNRFRSAGIGPDTPSDTKARACKVVVRDLSRVLCLISLKEEHLKTAPKDWDQLLSWTERLLVRYKRQEEMKLVGCKGEFDPSGSPPSRSLFVTRQQKAEQERRRWVERGPFNGISNQEVVLEQKNEDEHGSKVCPSSKQINVQLIEDPPKPLRHSGPPTKKEDVVHSKSSLDSAKNKRKDMLVRNKFFWHKLIARRDTKTADIDIEKSLDHNMESNLDFNSDDIPSQIFFDHIEAFAFDIQDELEPIHEPIDINCAPVLNVVSNRNSDYKLNISNNNNVLTINKNNTNNNNNLNIYKNFKNNRLILDVNSMNKLNLVNEQTNVCLSNKGKKNFVGKENKPNKLRRLSSTLLRKEKKHLVIKNENIKDKKRKPLKRQKLVEKEKQKMIHEKYKKIGVTNDDEIKSEMSFDSCQVDASTHPVNAPLNQSIIGGDVYLNIVKKTVIASSKGRKINPHSESINFGDEVKIHEHRGGLHNRPDVIEVPNERPTTYVKLRENKNHLESKLPKTFYPRCEILTSV